MSEKNSIPPPDDRSLTVAARFRFWDRVAYAASVVPSLVLAITGLFGTTGNAPLSGWPLLLHLIVAPLYMIGVTLLAIRYAHRCRLAPTNPSEPRASARADSPLPKNPARADTAPSKPGARPIPTGQKLLFWVSLILSFVAIATILAAMTPLFGYAAQQRLQGLHGASGIGLIVIGLAHFVLLLLGRRR